MNSSAAAAARGYSPGVTARKRLGSAVINTAAAAADIPAAAAAAVTAAAAAADPEFPLTA